MQLHQIKPNHKKKKKKRVGRGGKRGTYSGRGQKGQKSRAGRKLAPIVREVIKRYPKKRGYRFKSLKAKPLIVNIEVLEKKFKDSELVNPKTLLEKQIIRKMKGRKLEIKILGKGELKKALNIEGCQVSKGAKETIEKAGGTIRT